MLVSWVGSADIRGARARVADEIGPIVRALTQAGGEGLSISSALLLSEWPDEDWDLLERWLKERAPAVVVTRSRFDRLASPTAYRELVGIAKERISRALGRSRARPDLVYHVSSGTPAMQAVLLLISRTSGFEGTLVETSKERGLRVIDFPFEQWPGPTASAPLAAAAADRSSGMPRQAGDPFSTLIYEGEPMRRAVERARRAAFSPWPVLLLGASGTGKELLARAIHDASDRAGGPFVPVNCGAIPEGLAESELFGAEPGAATDLKKRIDGAFREAQRGTLFLDEVGDLSMPMQVKLLRVLQSGDFKPLGAAKRLDADVRIVAATNRDLRAAVAGGTFREDLWYRLAIAVIDVPALRERGSADVDLLVEHLLRKANRLLAEIPGPWASLPRSLTDDARKLMQEHSWPGNVREMESLLSRAVLWSDGQLIGRTELSGYLLGTPGSASGHPGVAEAVAEAETVTEVRERIAASVRPLLERALRLSGGNLTQAASIAGLGSYQTFKSWCRMYGVELPAAGRSRRRRADPGVDVGSEG